MKIHTFLLPDDISEFIKETAKKYEVKMTTICIWAFREYMKKEANNEQGKY